MSPLLESGCSTQSRAWGWWARLTPLTLLYTLGCAVQPAAKPTSVDVAPAPEVEAHSAPLAPPRAAPDCIVTETAIDGVIQLRFVLGGEPLAALGDAAARLALDAEPRFVELERGGVVVRTPFDPQERPLHLRRAVALGGVVTPKPHAEIVALDRAPGGQRVRYTTGSELGRAALEAAVSCADLALNTHEYEVRVDDEPDGEPVQLVGGVGVRATPGDRPSLELPSLDILAEELERRGGYVKIRVDTLSELLVGWVPEGAIGVVTMARGGGGSGYGAAFAHRTLRAHIRYVTCPHELTLFAELDGRAGEIGAVRPDARFEVMESIEGGAQAGFSVIDLWQQWIHPRPRVRLLVRSDGLGGCAAR